MDKLHREGGNAIYKRVILVMSLVENIEENCDITKNAESA